MCTTRTVINAHTNMGGMDLKLIPVAVRRLLGPLGMSGPFG